MILGEKKVPVEERLHMLGDPIGNGLVAVVLVDQDVNDEEGGVASRSMLRVAADHPEKNGRDNHTLVEVRENIHGGVDGPQTPAVEDIRLY